jgi:Peptidase A4 family
MRAHVLAVTLVVVSLVAPVPVVAASSPMFVHMPAVARTTQRGVAYSTNWSGYADYNHIFTEVRGAWTQPEVTCSSTGHRYAAFWIGLDGYTSSSVEQIGTDSDCAGQNQPVYYAWYEMYPAGSVTLSSNYGVHAGDAMSADVSVSGTTFTLVLKNATRRWTFITTQTSTVAKESSAEWVAEAPSSCLVTCSVLPLANFGSMHFTGAFLNNYSGTIGSYVHDNVTMATSGGTIKALPSALAGYGTSFGDTWYHS